MLYCLKLILNLRQLALASPSPFLTKRDSYSSTSHKNLQKQSNENFFIQVLYAWLHLTNNNIPPL